MTDLECTEIVNRLRERVATLEAEAIALRATLLLAKDELERRLSDMNQFRTQIEKERGDFLRKELYDREHQFLVGRVTMIEQSRTFNGDFNALKDDVQLLKQSRAGAMGTMAAYGSIVTFILAAGSLILALLNRLSIR